MFSSLQRLHSDKQDNALLKILHHFLRPNISLAASDNMGAPLFHAETQTWCQLFGWYFIFQRKVLLHCQTKRKYQYFARASLVVCAIAKKFRKIHFASPTPSMHCGKNFPVQLSLCTAQCAHCALQRQLIFALWIVLYLHIFLGIDNIWIYIHC